MSETVDDAAAAVRLLGARVSNWGRWGADDELGTLNFVTSERRVEAARLVRTGKVFDLGMPYDANGPQRRDGRRRFNPVHTMSVLPSDGERAGGAVVADDVVTMPLQCATQWDALSHVGYDGMLYNAVPTSEVTATAGAQRNSIDKVVERLLGRGVLLDVAALHGAETLEPQHEVTADDLSAAADRQGADVRSGDLLLVRTGWYRHFLAGDRETYMGDAPGLGISCVEWLHEREVAALACDNYAVEIRPSREPGVDLPLHMVLIRDMGMTIGEMFNFEQLAPDCAADGVWEFLFAGAPLKFTNAVGSPLSPIAVK